MNFFDRKNNHHQKHRDELVYGCFTRPQPSNNLFLKRNQHNLSQEEFCSQPYQNGHENQSFLVNGQQGAGKMSLKKDNTKALAKTLEMRNTFRPSISSKQRQDKSMPLQKDSQPIIDSKTSQTIQKNQFSAYPIYNQINRPTQIAQVNQLHLRYSRYQPQQHLNTNRVTWNPPKIQFQIQLPKIGHQRCKSQSQVFQKNLNQSNVKIQIPSQNFVSDMVEIQKDQQNKNLLNNSTINQKNEKKLGSRLSLQTILTSDSSKGSLIHFMDHHKAHDSLISNKSEATLNNTANSFQSFVSNGRKLKKIDQVMQVQSLGDENEVDSDQESIVLARGDQKPLIAEDEAEQCETWQQSQKRLIKVSRLLKSQSLDIL